LQPKLAMDRQDIPAGAEAQGMRVMRMTGKASDLTIMTCLLVVAMLTTGCVSAKSNAGDARSTIRDTLVGTNLTYYNFAGRPMNFTIGENDIGNAVPTTFDGKDAWKVRVGQGMTWDLTMDANGTAILRVDQLFQT